MSKQIKDIKNLGSIDISDFEIVTIGNEMQCGESILVHLPHIGWMIVDCCKTELYEGDHELLPLAYLKWREQSKDDVKYIVCTHWHTDHCEGMAQLLKECSNATLVLSKHTKQFVNFYMKKLKQKLDSGEIQTDISDEFANCYALITGDKPERDHIYATGDKRIINSESQVYALSPSDDNSDEYDRSLLKIRGKRNAKALGNPNKQSIALSIHYNGHNVLLGGDLEKKKINRTKKYPKGSEFNEREQINLECILKECSSCVQGNDLNTSKEGWCFAVNRNVEFNEPLRYSIVKIPHHGSSTAYCPKLYKEHTIPDSVGMSTCFEPSGLPSQAMIDRLHKHMNSIYLTGVGKNITSSIESGDEQVDDYFSKCVEVGTFKKVKDVGVIVSRLIGDKWDTDCYGTASLVS